MVLLETPKVVIDSKAIDFKLKNIDEKFYSLNDLKGENGTIIIFMCNHCPYVKAIINRLVKDSKELKEKYKLNTIAIMSNDTEEYEEDSFENMKKLSKEMNFSFPYLLDENQDIAKKYSAVCTPDFFGFDKNLKLKYRGRLDNFTMGDNSNKMLERELFDFMILVSQGKEITKKQNPSMGCSIKWKI